MNAPAIAIRNLCKSFPNFALGPLDLTVPRGAIYGLIGPNGSGKSTTLDLIFGMGAPDRGTIQAAGYDAATEAVTLKQRVTYSSPDTSFAVWGKVGRVLRFVRPFYASWDETLCERLRGAFRLNPEDKIATLSFGARTKLSLLLALSAQPEVLVLDEPTTGLDPETRAILFAELLRFVEDGERSVLISSHQLADVERFADHLGVLSQGRIICEGSLEQLLTQHRLLEYSLSEGTVLPTLPGFYPRQTTSGWSQAVVDLALHPPATLVARGLQVHSETALPLEEIFLAMTSQRKEAA